MTSHKKRNIFSINNKYQMGIVFLIAAPLFVISLTTLIVLYIMNTQINTLISNESYLQISPCITQWFYISICFTFVSLFIFMLLAFKSAYDLVNPFGRIILEVDEFLLTGEKRNIVVRAEDELAKEVSERINKLIKKIP